MSPYCPTCLDVWSLDVDRVKRGDFVNIRPGTTMHVRCGRALNAIATMRRAA